MALQVNILYFAFCILGSVVNLVHGSEVERLDFTQSDSLIQEKHNNSVLGSLDLLVLYQEAIKEKRHDSIVIFKNLALLNANLDQPKDAKIYSEKYIKNTLDFDILNDSAFNSIKGTDEYKTLKQIYLPKINVLVFLYFCAALIGFFFAFIINLIKGGNGYAKLFIGSFIAIHSLFILEVVLFISNLRLSYPHTYRMSSVVALLFGPLLYFYIKSVTQESKLKTTSLLHFVPTIVLLFFLMPIYTESAPEKLRMMLKISSVNKGVDLAVFLAKAASLIFYAFYVWKILFSKIKINHLLYNKPSVKKWFKNLYAIHISYIISYLVYGIFAFVILTDISSYISHFQVVAMTFMVLYIAYMSFVQHNIFKGELEAHDMLLIKYQKSSLTPGLSNELKKELTKVLLEDKIYKQNNISLDILSEKLNTTRHSMSQIINEHFKMNFFELINTFRIQEAKKILDEDVHGNLNIIDVAYEVGYNNKVTFNKAFKKETSLTPTQYLQRRQKTKPKVKQK
jgi:AraC-like DNA-binding protein